MAKKKGISDSERRRRAAATEKASEFNVKTKGMRHRLNPGKAAQMAREDKGIPIKLSQMPPRPVELIRLDPGDHYSHYERYERYEMGRPR